MVEFHTPEGQAGVGMDIFSVLSKNTRKVTTSLAPVKWGSTYKRV